MGLFNKKKEKQKSGDGSGCTSGKMIQAEAMEKTSAAVLAAEFAKEFVPLHRYGLKTEKLYTYQVTVKAVWLVFMPARKR